jgi:hypothetical protein
MKHAVIVAATISVLGASLATATQAQAQGRDMAQYFKGKTITVIVGSAAGGGADFNARLFAQNASKHFPGNPTFIVKNMPGADQLTGLQAGVRSKGDGLTAASLNARWAIQSILGEDLGPFNIRTARIAGSPIAGGRAELFCTERKIAGSWDQFLALKEPVRFAGEAGGRSSLGALLLEMVGAPVKNVQGYGGVAEETAAFDRGEMTAMACNEATVPRLFPEWITQKRLVPHFWWDLESKPEYLKSLGVASGKLPNMLDVPGVKFPAETKTVVDVSMQMFAFTRAIVLPPDTPDDIYQQWVKSYAAVHADPEVIAAGAKGGIEIQLGKADDFLKAVDQAKTLSKDGLELFRKLMVPPSK